MPQEELDLSTLPEDVRQKLNQLKEELLNEEITQKGFDKKKLLLIGPYIQALLNHDHNIATSPSTRAKRRKDRRLTREESRYKSDIRHESVQIALAQWNKSEIDTNTLTITKKTTPSTDLILVSDSMMEEGKQVLEDEPTQLVKENIKLLIDSKQDSPDANTSPSSTSPIPNIPTPTETSVLKQLILLNSAEDMDCHDDQFKFTKTNHTNDYVINTTASNSSSNNSSSISRPLSPNNLYQNYGLVKETNVDEESWSESVNLFKSNPIMNGFDTVQSKDSSKSAQFEGSSLLPLKTSKVSTKIQALLESLQRPKTKPLHEYYNDDDAELEVMAKIVDPNAPRPEGSFIQPVRGEFPSSTPTTLAPSSDGEGLGSGMLNNYPRSIDAALHRYGTSNGKAVAGLVLDSQGKPGQSITYAKLLSRANKLAFTLLTKSLTNKCVIGHSQNQSVQGKENSSKVICKSGDRVALIFNNNEPLAFMTAFYGCILGGLVPVPIEVPTTKKDGGIQQIGFLLGSCGVRTALTTEQSFKSLPKKSLSSGSTANGALNHPSDLIDLKSWPKLNWVMTENVSKPSRDWTSPPKNNQDFLAYIEHSTDGEGSVKGVAVSKSSVVSHTKSITAAMSYREGETLICVLDFKREMGLWGILASIFNGMKVVFVPYSLMKTSPASWMVVSTKLGASHVILKSRDLHWSLLASKDQKDINLGSVRSIIIADGANPWSLSSCDQFSSAFQKKGLRPEVLCPCSGSTETGLISVRRPSFIEYSTGTGSSSLSSNTPSGRGILSMQALSHSVVRVDKENSLTSLTLQDAGQIIPGAVAVVIKQTGPPKLCKADEIGEICIAAPSTASYYWGLDGVSGNTFRVEPLGQDDKPISCGQHYVRSGLAGFLGPDGLVFVVGNKGTMMNVSGRQHSADDLIATVLAVEPIKFCYRGRIAIFSINVLRDQRICIVAEQKAQVTEEEAFNWITRVLNSVDNVHQVGIYCLALVQANQMPKTALGGIHVSETRQRFLDCTLHPTTLLMCPHNCVLNLPKPREQQQSEVGPAAMYVGNIVQGVRIAGALGRELLKSTEDSRLLIDILKERAIQSPDHILFTLINSKGIEVETINCAQLLKKAERIGALLLDKGHLSPGDHVALIFPPGIDLIAAFYGAQIAGLISVCIRPPHPSALQSTLPTVRMMVDVSKSVALLTTATISKLLKSKEAAHRIDTKAWPNILDIEDSPSSSFTRKRNPFQNIQKLPSDTCYLDFNVSTTGQLAGIVVTNYSASVLCKSLKVAGELYPSRHVTLSLDPYCGLGFSLWVLSSIFSGHHSILIPPHEVELNPSLFLSVVSTQAVRDVFLGYGVMELCVKELAPQIDALKKTIHLTNVRTCIAVAEERPRVALCSAFAKLFGPLGLQSRSVSTSFGCRVNTAICMQGAASPDPATVYVDARALRNDRVSLVEKGSPHSIALTESGKLLPGIKVVIANPETRGQCADSHLGEIWVSSPHNASGYFSIFGEEATLHTDHFNAKLKTGDTKTTYARTGYLGFLRQTQSITANGTLSDALFVVGSLDETLMLRGMRYHPVDIEVTVVKTNRKILECATFSWTNRLVIVAEVEGSEAEALDLVPAITSSVLEEHHIIVGVVVLIDPTMIPVNTRGEKQRMHLRDSFLREELDPIYIAYNM